MQTILQNPQKFNASVSSSPSNISQAVLFCRGQGVFHLEHGYGAIDREFDEVWVSVRFGSGLRAVKKSLLRSALNHRLQHLDGANRVGAARREASIEFLAMGIAENSNGAGNGHGPTRTAVLNAREIKARVDLAAITGKFTKLRALGGQLLGLCPLHSEGHPSFYVHPEKQVFKCFGCGAGGDVFAFVMRATGCNFRRALEIVAACSEQVARDSESRSGSRLGAGVGAQPLSPAQRGALHSQCVADSRARILSALDATNRRLQRIEETNRKSSAELATACEPQRGFSPLLVKNRITLQGEGCDE
jgi:hypothetical protein